MSQKRCQVWLAVVSAHLSHQSGPFASRFLTTVPVSSALSYPCHLFRVLLLRRLRPPLPLAERTCRWRSGRNAGVAYERKDWLPINELGSAMTRHPVGLTEEQVACGGGPSKTPRGPSSSSRTRRTTWTPRGAGWSARRARTTGTRGRRWRRCCGSACRGCFGPLQRPSCSLLPVRCAPGARVSAGACGCTRLQRSWSQSHLQHTLCGLEPSNFGSSHFGSSGSSRTQNLVVHGLFLMWPPAAPLLYGCAANSVVDMAMGQTAGGRGAACARRTPPNLQGGPCPRRPGLHWQLAVLLPLRMGAVLPLLGLVLVGCRARRCGHGGFLLGNAGLTAALRPCSADVGSARVCVCGRACRAAGAGCAGRPPRRGPAVPIAAGGHALSGNSTGRVATERARAWYGHTPPWREAAAHGGARFSGTVTHATTKEGGGGGHEPFGLLVLPCGERSLHACSPQPFYPQPTRKSHTFFFERSWLGAATAATGWLRKGHASRIAVRRIQSLVHSQALPGWTEEAAAHLLEGAAAVLVALADGPPVRGGSEDEDEPPFAGAVGALAPGARSALRRASPLRRGDGRRADSGRGGGNGGDKGKAGKGSNRGAGPPGRPRGRRDRRGPAKEVATKAVSSETSGLRAQLRRPQLQRWRPPSASAEWFPHSESARGSVRPVFLVAQCLEFVQSLGSAVASTCFFKQLSRWRIPTASRHSKQKGRARLREGRGVLLGARKRRRTNPWAAFRVGEALRPGPNQDARRQRALHALAQMGLTSEIPVVRKLEPLPSPGASEADTLTDTLSATTPFASPRAPKSLQQRRTSLRQDSLPRRRRRTGTEWALLLQRLG